MKELNKILYDKITLLLRKYLNSSQLLDYSNEIEAISLLKSFDQKPEELLEVNLKGVAARKLIDKTISFANENLSTENYQKSLYDLASMLAECEEMNISEEILTNLINDVKSEQLKAESLLVLADILIRKSFWDKSIILIVQAKELFEDLNDTVGVAKCENLCGTYYGERGEIVSARNHFINSLNLLNENEDDKLAANIESNLAILEIVCGNYDTAKKYFTRAINKFEKLGEYKRIAIQRHNMGMMYLDQKTYDRAIVEFDSVISLATNKQYHTILAISYLGKANALALMNKNKEGLEFCYKAMDIAIRIEDRLTIADVYRVFGIIERNFKHFDLAEKYLNISLRLNDEVKNRLNTAETSYEFGLLYNESGNNKGKEDWLKKALIYYEEIKAAQKVNHITELLATT
ncbi:tetratricopeptide repeat protein [bacterium BMS3Abin03]|nr:tetratricopeptide repeat protein [bacterium BMS3Abin03]MCG6958637.1 tetratricopeptide repeat protein [bacterium BMS3Abin03]